MAKAYAVTIWTSIQNEELCHYVISPNGIWIEGNFEIWGFQVNKNKHLWANKQKLFILNVYTRALFSYQRVQITSNLKFGFWFERYITRTVYSLRIGSCLACVDRVMDARGKFGEHERSVRVARGAAESNSSFLSALQTSQVHP